MQFRWLWLVLAAIATQASAEDYNISIPIEYRENVGYFIQLPFGSMSFDMLIDTGSTVGLIFPDTIAVTLEEEGWIRESGDLMRVTLANGATTEVEMFVATVSFGGCKADEVDMLFTENQRHGYGLIGYTLLEQFAPFKIEINPPNNTLYMTCKKRRWGRR